MVVLARDKETNELFALKFIERGPQVSIKSMDLGELCNAFLPILITLSICQRAAILFFFLLLICFSRFSLLLSNRKLAGTSIEKLQIT